MKKSTCFVLLVHLALFATATADAGATGVPHRQPKSIGPVSGSKGENAYELERCVRNWGEMNATRARVDASEAPRSVLLEVGNSAFPRYDYVLIEKGLMTSSMGPAINVSTEPFEDLLDQIFSADASELHSGAGSSIEDGDCYFLTLKEGGSKKTIEVYGESGSGLFRSFIDQVLRKVAGPGGGGK